MLSRVPHCVESIDVIKNVAKHEELRKYDLQVYKNSHSSLQNFRFFAFVNIVVLLCMNKISKG